MLIKHSVDHQKYYCLGGGILMKSILAAIEEGRWEDALSDFMDYTEKNELYTDGCIVGATIFEQFNDFETMHKLIIKGLKQDNQNYELYLLLGNYYLNENINQAYITYEQALFLAIKAGKEDDASIIRKIMESHFDNNSVSVRGTSILIIEDENKGHLDECKRSIESTCYLENKTIIVEQTDEYTGVPGAINRALKKSNAEYDIMVLSSDVVLMQNALYELRMGLYADDDIGACSARCNISSIKKMLLDDWDINTISDMQRYASLNCIQEKSISEIRPILDINFILLSREAIDLISPISEKYITGEGFGKDLCLTFLEHDLKNKACWNSFVYRYHNSTGYTQQYVERVYKERGMIKEKWGFEPSYYKDARIDLVSLISEQKDEDISVLEVGCGLGSTLTCVSSRYPNSKVRGIELVESVARIGKKIANVECANIEKYVFKPDEKFDYIIFGDVLEHLVDPYTLIYRLREQLNDGGCILASIPNIMNAGVIYDLLHGNFTYQDSGILDRTHMRFFTYKEIQKMFNERGYTLEVAVASTSSGNTTSDHPEFWKKLLAIEGVSSQNEFDAYQYIFRAKKN